MSVCEIVTDVIELKKENDDATLEEAEEIIKKLELSLKASQVPGIGLAAPQIGIHKKVAIIRINNEEKLNLVNPYIVEKKHGFILNGEGCLSVPGKKVNTRRFKEILIKDDLHPAGLVLTDMVAIVVQHEVDHLYKILITDRDLSNQPGRNDPCFCGSGKKFKKCHGK